MIRAKGLAKIKYPTIAHAKPRRREEDDPRRDAKGREGTETYRLFEALRSGCVVIADKQPKKWYYDTVPAIFVEDWSELESIVTDLLNDPKELKILSEQSLLWWQHQASPSAVASYICDEFNFECKVEFETARLH